MQNDFYDQIQKLPNTGNPFVIATVVRAEKPTSAKVGAKAIITDSGMSVEIASAHFTSEYNERQDLLFLRGRLQTII